jgi:transportin-1
MAMAEYNVVRGHGGQKVQETFQKVRLSLKMDSKCANMVNQVIQQYRSMIPNFDAFIGGLPADQPARFRELYRV